MLDNLEQNQRVGAGVGSLSVIIAPSAGLGNTNPVATLGSMLGLDVRAVSGRAAKPITAQWLAVGQVFPVRDENFALVRSFEVGVSESGVRRPLGQIVFFKKVMEQWGFRDDEAATLLGFDDAADIRDIYRGRKSPEHRDTNDRVRAVLRIAADLDALYDDEAAIRDWLNEPQSDLGGSSPHALLTEGSMENLLQVKYYVAHLSGR